MAGARSWLISVNIGVGWQRHGWQYRGLLACHAYVIYARARHGRQILSWPPNTRGSLRKSHYDWTAPAPGTARSKGVNVPHGRLAWVRRVSFAAVLIVAAV